MGRAMAMQWTSLTNQQRRPLELSPGFHMIALCLLLHSTGVECHLRKLGNLVVGEKIRD
jgi:hypothetical protein